MEGAEVQDSFKLGTRLRWYPSGTSHSSYIIWGWLGPKATLEAVVSRKILVHTGNLNVTVLSSLSSFTLLN